jgi:hypothetical protein
VVRVRVRVRDRVGARDGARVGARVRDRVGARVRDRVGAGVRVRVRVRARGGLRLHAKARDQESAVEGRDDTDRTLTDVEHLRCDGTWCEVRGTWNMDMDMVHGTWHERYVVRGGT